MTDKEIIKALECCYDLDSSAICHQCPLYQTENCRDGYLGLQALHLINRQKAEVERLEEEIDKQYEQAKADILGNMADGGTSCHWCIEQHKADAIKEFAERLKESKKQYEGTLAGWTFTMTELDNLVKEMVGDTE